jgi:hypothetical protein
VTTPSIADILINFKRMPSLDVFTFRVGQVSSRKRIWYA